MAVRFSQISISYEEISGGKDMEKIVSACCVFEEIVEGRSILDGPHFYSISSQARLFYMYVSIVRVTNFCTQSSNKNFFLFLQK